MKLAVKKFLSALRPADRVTLVGFNDNVFTLARPTADSPRASSAVDRLAPWGGTALYDVVVKAIDQLGRQTGRRALVVFTDGEDLNSRVPDEAAEQRLEASDAVLYPIGQGRAPKLEALKQVLERLAQKSGGRAFFEDLDELDAVFARIVEELSNQYLLGYPRPEAAKDRQLAEAARRGAGPRREDPHAAGLSRRVEVERRTAGRRRAGACCGRGVSWCVDSRRAAAFIGSQP